MKKVLVIGGGAAGMAAAIAAAQKGDAVTVWDRNRKPLKKLGVTGNGRGNLLNCGQPEFYGDTDFAMQVLHHMPYERIAAFLEDCGIPLTEEDEGRMYPASFLAASAVEALKHRAQALGVRIETGVRAETLIKQNGRFCAQGLRAAYAPDTLRKSGKTKPGELLGEESCAFTADRVIVAVGGAAAPMHGTDGTAYGLLTAFGHKLLPIRPALCALTTDTAPIRGLEGQRVRAALKLCAADGQVLHQSQGEALFAADGVSGIAAMQLSRFVSDGCVLHMDLRRAVTGRADTDMRAWLRARAARAGDAQTLLLGACTAELAAALWKRPSLDASALDALAQTICDFALPLTGVRGFDSAQVTAGGVDCGGFDPSTMESRLCAGLYAAGEVLDVDGGCGGHNLMFAFASGLLAGGF